MITEFIKFLKHIFTSKKLLFSLVKNDFKQQYLGSYLGFLWAFIQPVTMIFIMWFVFEIGFKTKAVSTVPFILWLSCGIIPWYFFAEGVSSGTHSIVGSSYLVKKVSFRVSLLPLVKIIAAFYVHLFFIVLLIIIFLLYGYTPSIYWLQLPYYILCMFVLVLGISWLTSSINVFFKDISQFVAIVLQLMFWGTPIFWQINQIPIDYQWILKLNPVFYIVEGYRNTFIDHVWFWETYKITPYFLLITLLLFILGAFTFKRLRPYFADVL